LVEEISDCLKIELYLQHPNRITVKQFNLKRMKKVFFTVFLAMALTSSMAQDVNNGNRRPQAMTAESMTEMMVKKLELSTEQATKVKELNNRYSDLFKGPGMGGGQPPRKPDETNSNGNGSNSEPPQMTDEMKSEMKANQQKRQQQRTAYEKELKSILSSDQYSAYEKMKPQRKGKRQ
jgi:hypothetical protein